MIIRAKSASIFINGEEIKINPHGIEFLQENENFDMINASTCKPSKYTLNGSFKWNKRYKGMNSKQWRIRKKVWKKLQKDLGII